MTYEVEFLEGDQKGAIGWIRERWLVFDGPPPEGPGRPDGFLCPTPENRQAFPADSLWILGDSPPPFPGDTIRF